MSVLCDECGKPSRNGRLEGLRLKCGECLRRADELVYQLGADKALEVARQLVPLLSKPEPKDEPSVDKPRRR